MPAATVARSRTWPVVRPDRKTRPRSPSNRPRRAAHQVPLSGLYNTYNALAATAGAVALGISHARESPSRSMASAPRSDARSVSPVAGSDVQVLLSKNPTGLNQVLAPSPRTPARAHALLPQRRHRRRPRHLLDLDTDSSCCRPQAEWVLRRARAQKTSRCAWSTQASAMTRRWNATRRRRSGARSRRRRRGDALRRTDLLRDARSARDARAQDGRASASGRTDDRALLRVAHLCPRLMNIYGNREQSCVCAIAARARGVGFELTELSTGDALDSAALQPYLRGRRQAGAARRRRRPARHQGRRRSAKPSRRTSRCSPSAAPTSSSRGSIATPPAPSFRVGVFDLETHHPLRKRDAASATSSPIGARPTARPDHHRLRATAAARASAGRARLARVRHASRKRRRRRAKARLLAHAIGTYCPPAPAAEEPTLADAVIAMSPAPLRRRRPRPNRRPCRRSAHTPPPPLR